MDMTEPQWWLRLALASRRAAGVFLRDVGNGLLEVSHNMLALVGLLVVGSLVFALGHADVRSSVERQALDWLQQRHTARADELGYVAGPDDTDTAALARSLAADPATRVILCCMETCRNGPRLVQALALVSGVWLMIK